MSGELLKNGAHDSTGQPTVYHSSGLQVRNTNDITEPDD